LELQVFAAYQFLNPTDPGSVAQAASEPTCNNRTATGPSFNQFPKRTSVPNPEYIAGDCFDMPTLTHFNLGDLAARNRVVNPNQTFTIQDVLQQ
jgi:hypothetical protein